MASLYLLRLQTKPLCVRNYDPLQWYLYFDVVVGLVWSKNPDSYAGGSVATGRASRVEQVKSDDPDEKGYTLVLQVGGWTSG